MIIRFARFMKKEKGVDDIMMAHNVGGNNELFSLA